MPHDFPLKPADPAEMVHLVFFTYESNQHIEAYANKEHADRAAAHYKRRGFAPSRTDSRALRGEAYLTMIGA
jgi:hypothetical protein